MAPLNAFIFFKFYKKKIIILSKSLNINEKEGIYFYNKVFWKFYTYFSPDKFLIDKEFSFIKISFSLYAAKILSLKTNQSIKEIIDSSSAELKHIIKDSAVNVNLIDLKKVWANRNVTLFNIFNTIKFSKQIFNELPLLNASVLDVGSSVGTASWISAMNGAKEFGICDIDGDPLNLAEDILKSLEKKVIKYPISDQFVVPEFKKNTYDIALCLHVYEHTEVPLDLTNKIIDSLKPGGYFVYTYYEASVADGINTQNALINRHKVLKHLKNKLFHLKEFNLNPYNIAIKKV